TRVHRAPNVSDGLETSARLRQDGAEIRCCDLPIDVPLLDDVSVDSDRCIAATCRQCNARIILAASSDGCLRIDGALAQRALQCKEFCLDFVTFTACSHVDAEAAGPLGPARARIQSVALQMRRPFDARFP